MTRLDAQLRDLSRAIVSGMRRGIEKESLRVARDGSLATTPHPRELGAALTHPHITTDFSEAQLEFITGVHASADACLDELEDLHRFAYRHLGDEMLWCASMPCDLPEEDAIPIARYGRSNIGRAKTVYRIGLSHRYGRRMQLICGVHYNFSLPDDAWPVPEYRDADSAYFALIRNFRRRAWLLLYLFGASPVACASFVRGRPHELRELSPGTVYLPYATSLRMGRLGYLSDAQEALAVSYNDLESYAASLDAALTRPHAPYAEIGIGDGDDYRQLTTSLLQIENEFYSTIRPKRVVLPGERPLRALRERGVQYVEVRAMDLDPFAPIGITAQTARFLDIFLLHCLLVESPPDTPAEIRAVARNKVKVAARGREPGLELEHDGGNVNLRSWARAVLAECAPIAAALDAVHGTGVHHLALAAANHALDDPPSLPSARVLREVTERFAGSYFDFARAYSLQHKRALKRQPLAASAEARLAAMAQESLDKQQMIEAKNDVPFETYRRLYLAPASLRAR